MCSQQLLRAVDRELEGLHRLRWKVQIFEEFLILVAADIREAFDLPGHHGRQAVLRHAVGPPGVEGDGLPGLMPSEVADRNRRCRSADVCAKREETIEASKEGDVPW